MCVKFDMERWYVLSMVWGVHKMLIMCLVHCSHSRTYIDYVFSAKIRILPNSTIITAITCYQNVCNSSNVGPAETLPDAETPPHSVKCIAAYRVNLTWYVVRVGGCTTATALAKVLDYSFPSDSLECSPTTATTCVVNTHTHTSHSMGSLLSWCANSAWPVD